MADLGDATNVVEGAYERRPEVTRRERTLRHQCAERGRIVNVRNRMRRGDMARAGMIRFAGMAFARHGVSTIDMAGACGGACARLQRVNHVPPDRVGNCRMGLGFG